MTDSEQYQTQISTYIRAKDGNRPWLMKLAFSPDVQLRMKVDNDNIDFPAQASGLTEVTDTLVRNFARENDNVFTFCLNDSLSVQGQQLNCDWVVFMTDRDTGRVRIGWGQYQWDFNNEEMPLIRRLEIRIEQMDLLPALDDDAVFSRICALPYPWLERSTLLEQVKQTPCSDDLARFLTTG